MINYKLYKEAYEFKVSPKTTKGIFYLASTPPPSNFVKKQAPQCVVETERVN